MKKYNKIPMFDKNGLNILDPEDKKGYKSNYITMVQGKALKKYLPEGNNKDIALDVGCGYGRLSKFLKMKGWVVIGIDPDPQLIQIAKNQIENIEFKIGALPDLPVAENSAGLIMLNNVLRPLKLLNNFDAVKGLSRYLKYNGNLIVIENIYHKNDNYVDEKNIIETFKKEDLILTKKEIIRLGRWWLLYLIRYGFIPINWFDAIAKYERKKILKMSRPPFYCYVNTLYVFKKENNGSF